MEHPKNIFRTLLKLKPIFVLFFSFIEINGKVNDFLSNPNAFDLAISNSCEIQPKAFDR